MKAITTKQIGDLYVSIKSKAADFGRMAGIAPEHADYWNTKKAEALELAETLQEMRDRVYFSKDLRARFTIRL